ncbi:response regulator [Silicimonas algicola]|uniref:Putative glycosyltransferase n=1 Tax=Silicimonas algicola TaxID=1826607 RepID=A0A316G4C2_9RHOB|nr:response regulator [Silicimonas algicola]AZQ68238.1 response regulator [Silicimonas algicola]PWK54630.1 putative glycosyltransferase [Silicimonas algicola]
MTRILLAEDEPVLARNIALSLRKTGAEVIHAPSAATAREALRRGGFDLVIADISLGDGDGLDVLGEASEILHGTPVIVMTGQDSVANRARAEGLTVAAFLSKPFALSRLRELVGALTRPAAPGGSASAGPSVVMYSHDTIGLGHMRRNSAIARELVAQVPGVSVLMLVGCPAGMVFEPHPGIDYVKLPSLAKLGRGAYQAGSLRIDPETTRAMRSRIIEGVLTTIELDLFLVDHEPAGAMEELVPILGALRERGRVRTVLGLRDILDDPARTRSGWAQSGTDRLISESYDHVLVYGDRRFFPSAEAYGLDLLKPGAVTECGVVTTVRTRVRPAFPAAPSRIVVSGGGGRDAYPLIEAAIKAVRTLPVRRRPHLIVVTGPLMDEELKSEARRLGTVTGVTVLEHVPDLPGMMEGADLLVTMTGYNSINEALALDCPIVTVPRLGPSSEQRLRAEALERQGLARYLRREDLTPEALARLMSEPPPRVPPHRLKSDGVTTAARVLAAMIADVRTPLTEERAHA